MYHLNSALTAASAVIQAATGSGKSISISLEGVPGSGKTALNQESTTSRWRFMENYPGIGAALVDGHAIVAIKDASEELINSCPEAVEWLKGKF